MSLRPEQKPFLRLDGPGAAAAFGDMSTPNPSRPSRSYFYAVTAAFAICLLTALGTILVLVLQRTGSTSHCDGHQGNQRRVAEKCAMQGLQSRTPEKAAAYLQVLKPVNQSALRWNAEGLLYNMGLRQEALTVRLPGLYFVYCHLHFFVRKCDNRSLMQRLELWVNDSPAKHTTRNLCGDRQHPPARGVYQDLFQVLLVELKEGDRIRVRIDPIEYLDNDLSPKNNVLGAFKYTGEEGGLPWPGGH